MCGLRHSHQRKQVMQKQLGPGQKYTRKKTQEEKDAPVWYLIGFGTLILIINSALILFTGETLISHLSKL